MTEIRQHDTVKLSAMEEDEQEKWGRLRALTLPKSMSNKLKEQVKEPLRRSDTIHKSLARSASIGSEAGLSSSASQLSIINAEGGRTWKNRVRYLRADGHAERVRLSRDVYDLWHPFLSRPTDFEIHRPWLFVFDFKEDPDSTEHCYGWTSLAMFRAAHAWVQANRMVENRIAKMFLCFDGNFDVIASKKTGRISVPNGLVDEASSCSVHVLDEEDDPDPLPPDSEEEQLPAAPPPKAQGWVNILIGSERKVCRQGHITTAPVPYGVLVCRSENSPGRKFFFLHPCAT